MRSCPGPDHRGCEADLAVKGATSLRTTGVRTSCPSRGRAAHYGNKASFHRVLSLICAENICFRAFAHDNITLSCMTPAPCDITDTTNCCWPKWACRRLRQPPSHRLIPLPLVGAALRSGTALVVRPAPRSPGKAQAMAGAVVPEPLNVLSFIKTLEPFPRLPHHRQRAISTCMKQRFIERDAQWS